MPFDIYGRDTSKQKFNIYGSDPAPGWTQMPGGGWARKSETPLDAPIPEVIKAQLRMQYEGSGYQVPPWAATGYGATTRTYQNIPLSSGQYLPEGADPFARWYARGQAHPLWTPTRTEPGGEPGGSYVSSREDLGPWYENYYRQLAQARASPGGQAYKPMTLRPLSDWGKRDERYASLYESETMPVEPFVAPELVTEDEILAQLELGGTTIPAVGGETTIPAGPKFAGSATSRGMGIPGQAGIYPAPTPKLTDEELAKLSDEELIKLGETDIYQAPAPANWWDKFWKRGPSPEGPGATPPPSAKGEAPPASVEPPITRILDSPPAGWINTGEILTDASGNLLEQWRGSVGEGYRTAWVRTPVQTKAPAALETVPWDLRLEYNLPSKMEASVLKFYLEKYKADRAQKISDEANKLQAARDAVTKTNLEANRARQAKADEATQRTADANLKLAQNTFLLELRKFTKLVNDTNYANAYKEWWDKNQLEQTRQARVSGEQQAFRTYVLKAQEAGIKAGQVEYQAQDARNKAEQARYQLAQTQQQLEMQRELLPFKKMGQQAPVGYRPFRQ